MEEINNEDFEVQLEEESPKRPTGLLILCILTLINSGYSFLYYLFLPAFKNLIPLAYSQTQAIFGTNPEVENQVKMVMEFLTTVPSWKYLMLAIAFGIAIASAIVMLKMKKIGLHLYIIAQILIFCGLNFLIGGMLKMNVPDIMITLIFILFYYGQFKKAKLI